jgi:uncharacterized protein YjbJ (UPF0337 family)
LHIAVVERHGCKPMDEETLRGEWAQLKGRVRREWGKLTNDDIAAIQGDREVLVGRLQERYGHTREEVERELDDWPASRFR